MPDPVLKIVENTLPTIRRFDTADLSQHGKWILPRFIASYPHMNEWMAATFLRNLCSWGFRNEWLFLYSQTGVALAQVMSAHSLDPQPVVYERFVWVENKEDKEQLKQAAEFYTEILRWAKSQSAEAIIVEENTDVPHDLIKEKLGRIFMSQQQFARL